MAIKILSFVFSCLVLFFFYYTIKMFVFLTSLTGQSSFETE